MAGGWPALLPEAEGRDVVLAALEPDEVGILRTARIVAKRKLRVMVWKGYNLLQLETHYMINRSRQCSMLYKGWVLRTARISSSEYSLVVYLSRPPPYHPTELQALLGLEIRYRDYTSNHRLGYIHAIIHHTS